MAVWVCRNCTARYAVGLFRCPQCQAESSYEMEGSMSPKINRHGDVTDATAADKQEDAWHGNSSETSSEKPPTSDETNSPDDQSPAPTTESPSETDPTESSSAPSTGGSTTASSRRTTKKAASKKTGR